MASRATNRPGQRVSLWVDVLPAGQNSEAIPSSDEPGRSRAPEKHPAGNAPARSASLCRWHLTAQQTVPAVVRPGRHQTEAGLGNRRRKALGFERSPEGVFILRQLVEKVLFEGKFGLLEVP